MRLYFILLWIVCCLIFPMWFIIPNFGFRLLFYALMLIYFIVFSILLYKWFKDVDLKLKFDKYELWIVIIGILSQIVAIAFPITSRGDEVYHILRGMNIFNSLHSILGISTFALSWIFLVVLIIFGKRIFSFISNLRNKFSIYSIIIFSFVIGLLYFLVMNRILGSFSGDLQWLIRYPPISAILSSFELGLFGYQEWALRLVPMLFYVLSGVYFYKLVRLYRSKISSFLGALFLLFFPSYFYYGHTNYLESGLVFFILISSYYFLRSIKENNQDYAFVAFFFLSTGFLYKQPTIFLFPVFYFIILINNFKDIKNKKFSKLVYYIKMTLISLVPILPWIFIEYIYGIRGITLQFSKLFSFNMFNYIVSLPNMITIPLFVLFIFGVFYFIRFIDNLGWYALGLFSIFYVIFSLETASGATRLVIPYLPAVAIFAIYGFDGFIKNKIFKILSVLVVVFLVVFSLGSYYVDYKKDLLPINEAVKYVSDINHNTKILVQGQGLPYKFYVFKYKDDYNRYLAPDWSDLGKSSIEDLYGYVIDNDIDFVILPISGLASHEGRKINLWWGNGIVDESLVEAMLKDNNYFYLNNIFDYSGNRVAIWNVLGDNEAINLDISS